MKKAVTGRRMGWSVGLMVALAVGADLRTATGADSPVAAEPALKYEYPRFLAGQIYALDTKGLLFKFTRVASRSGEKLEVRRDFTYPDGHLAARERVVYEGDDLVEYVLEETQIGARGSARVRRQAGASGSGVVQFLYAPEPGQGTKTETEPWRDNTLIADMVGPFLAAHWQSLERGDKVKCRYIVVPRAETVGFTFVKDAEASRARQDVTVVRMEASSLFVGAMVEPLFFLVENSSPHRVLEYSGRTTPKIRVKGKWKDLDARTVFDWDTAR